MAKHPLELIPDDWWQLLHEIDSGLIDSAPPAALLGLKAKGLIDYWSDPAGNRRLLLTAEGERAIEWKFERDLPPDEFAGMDWCDSEGLNDLEAKRLKAQEERAAVLQGYRDQALF